MKEASYRISIPRLISPLFFTLCFLPGILSSRIVTLGSIEIFNTHEWAPFFKPTIYFSCQGGNETILPDVKKAHFLYVFKGEESWQPLTELTEKKCKRCGLYEADTFKPSDIFDEWELCPSDFIDGIYVHYKENEFNATFICPNCTTATDFSQTSGSNAEAKKKLNVGLIIVISALASVVVAAGTVALYRYLQRRRREQDQARFLKLFEEDDDIEDELGIAHVIL